MSTKPTFQNRLPMGSIESTPEWQAAMGQLSAEDYLALFGDLGGPIVEIEHSKGGDNPLWRKDYKRKR